MFWSVVAVAVLAVVAVLPCKHASLDVLAGHEAWLRENIDEHSLLSWSRYAGASEREAVSSRRLITIWKSTPS